MDLADVEIKPNRNIIKKLLYKPRIPSVNKAYTYQKIHESNPWYHKITDMLTLPRHLTIEVKTIHRLHNPYLLALYSLKKASLSSLEAVEDFLFHATQYHKVDSISSGNLNYRFSGTQRGTKYGQGISFTPRFYFACNFCDSCNIKVVFLCKVLYGATHVGDVNTVVPNEGCDASQSEDGKVIVKYDDDEFYPEYKIVFSLYENEFADGYIDNFNYCDIGYSDNYNIDYDYQNCNNEFSYQNYNNVQSSGFASINDNIFNQIDLSSWSSNSYSNNYDWNVNYGNYNNKYNDYNDNGRYHPYTRNNVTQFNYYNKMYSWK